MQIRWIEFLTKLGCTITNPTPEALQPCPLHSGLGNTLRIARDACDPDHGAWRFTCNESHCNFSGDAVMLLAQVRKISLDEAFGLFLPGQELASILEEDFTGSQLDEYRNSKSNQLAISNYLLQTQNAIRKSLKGTKLRNKMAAHGALQYGSQTLNDVPKTLGLLIPDDLPPVLRGLKPHSKAHCALYPYTYNGQVTHVRVQNFDEDSLPSQTIPIVRKDIGLFMENNVSDTTKDLFAATSEMVCCNLYRRWSEYSTRPPPLVGLAGLPLPHRFRNIERLIVLPSKEYKFSLAFALHLFSAPEVVEGHPDKKVPIFVGPEGRPMESIPLHTLEAPTLKPNHVAEALNTWIIHKLAKLIEDKDVEVIYKAFESNNVTKEQRTELLEKAATMVVPPELITLLETIGQLPQSVIRLANGRELRQTTTGLLALGFDNEERRLSNVAITVEECILTRSEDIKYVCKLRADSDGPAITAVLHSNAFTSAAHLRQAVRSVFIGQGLSIYPAFYEIKGFAWPDILAKLAEGKNVRHEIVTLGVNSSLIHFPNFVLDTARKLVEPQHQVFTLDRDILRLYNGLRYEAAVIDSSTSMRRLLEVAETNPYIAGFLFAFCHIVHNLIAALIRHENKVMPVPQHLLFVEPTPGIWTPIYLQLNQLFADIDEVSRMPSVKVTQYLAKLSQLGALPCIQILPNISCNRIKQLLGELDVNLISVVDSEVAIALTGDSRISFIDTPDYTAQQTYTLAPEDIMQLQASLPGILLELTSQTLTVEERSDFRNTEIPAVAAYHLMCRTLGVPINTKMENVIKHYYTANGISCIYMFMQALGEVISENKSPIRVVQGFPTQKELQDNLPTIFVMQDCVCIDHRVVNIVNVWGRHSNVFNPPSLSVDFERYNHIHPAKDFDIDRNRYWILDRMIWNKYIIGEPIVLRMVTNSNVVQLPRMIAGA